MPEQTPAATTTATTNATPATVTLTTPMPGPQPTASPTAAEKQPPWGRPEDFDADKAWELIENLRKEKGGDTAALRGQLEQMQNTMQQQRDALATALGVKPEETSDAQKLAEQINGLQKQVLDAERRAVSAATNVPEAMLTAADAEGIRAQAQALVEFAQASHYAALTAAPPAPAPAFQPNPGQGQGNTPLTPEAQAVAEYEKYYPSPSR